MLPKPASTFTIPSIHDDIPLDCRIYYPAYFLNSNIEGGSHGRKRGAIIAHPYAPLGGSFDDLIVLAAVEELLKHGFVVGTFNFRGAGGSKGRTSWTGKAELADYISFVGFFIYYLHGLDFSRSNSSVGDSFNSPSSPLSPIQSSIMVEINPLERTSDGMVLVLGGYSYGSLIAVNLPSTKSIVSAFASITKGTAESEIRLRAANLSSQYNTEARQCRRKDKSLVQDEALRSNPRLTVLGGEECEPGTRRTSRDSRRSLDAVRRSMDRSRTKLGLRKNSYDRYSLPPEEKLTIEDIAEPQTGYLLISPLLPPVSMFVTMSTGTRWHQKEDARPLCIGRNSQFPRAKGNMAESPTLAVYGDKDFFTSQKKLRKWAESMAGDPRSRFQFHEITGAGHFWHEEGVEAQMKKVIGGWITDLAGG